MSLTKFIRKLRGGMKRKLEEQKSNQVCLDMSQIQTKMLDMLYKKKVVQNALNVGEMIPISELEIYTGKKIKVKELLKKGPIVLTFFRGNWCHYCVAEIKFLQENIQLFEELGATVIAVSPQSKEETRKLAEANSIEYKLIADTSNKVSKKFGLSFTIPEEIVSALSQGPNALNLKEFYGKDEIEIPVPATYVIDSDGRIVYAFINENFMKRADVAEIAYFVRKCKIDKKAYLSRCNELDCVIKSFVKGFQKKVDTIAERGSRRRYQIKSESIFESESSLEDLDPFKFCLNDEELLESFSSYLTKTFCLENLFFYFEVEQYEANFSDMTPIQNQEASRKIFEEYIMVESQLEVNVDDTIRDEIVKNLKEPIIPKTIFSNAHQEIYKLMETDSYSKWKRTKEYARIWEKKGSPKFLSPTPSLVSLS